MWIHIILAHNSGNFSVIQNMEVLSEWNLLAEQIYWMQIIPSPASLLCRVLEVQTDTQGCLLLLQEYGEAVENLEGVWPGE